MNNSTNHIVVGVITSIFLSPFVGGGIAGYLAGPDIRKGIKVGGIIGVTIAVLFSSIALLYIYYGIYQPLSALMETSPDGMAQGAGQTFNAIILPKLVATALFFGGSIIGGLIGGGIGSYIAAHQPPRNDQPSSAS